MNPASLLSAISATVAALLVAVNLYVSGRREHSRWAREALVDVFVAFLDAGFARVVACERLIDLPAEATETEAADWRTEIARAHRTETEMLTKLRVLTADRVVEAAMALHLATHTYEDLVAAGTVTPSERNDADEGVWRGRYSFLRAAKGEIGLKPVVSLVRHESQENRSLPRRRRRR